VVATCVPGLPIAGLVDFISSKTGKNIFACSVVVGDPVCGDTGLPVSLPGDTERLIDVCGERRVGPA